MSAWADQEEEDAQLFEGESTAINFDAYEDIPVETSGQDVPPGVETFADIAEKLGSALMANIFEETKKFAYQTGVRPVVCYGGHPWSTSCGRSNAGATC
eukprot:jgi/Pico_ML_1/51419/g2452.t2